MTKAQFRAALKRLGWSQARFSRRTGVNATTVSRWMKPNGAVPKWVAEYLRVMVLVAEMID